VVYCHDTGRDLVQRVRLRHCSGRIVTPKQASEIHARIEAERRSRQTRTLTQSATRQKNGIRFKSAAAAFAVNQRGELLTSAHVVRGCDVLEARSLTPHRARVKALATDSDLAILQIGARTPDVLQFSAQSPTDGSPLALIGYPSEGMIRRIPTMTPVLISHAISHPSQYGLVGIAGDVRRGNSGGPALDSRGRAVGVLKAKINTVAAHKMTGRVLTDLGVIVETSRVLRFLERSRTPFAIARDTSEKSGRTLFEQGRRAVYRIDCLVRE
jgi:S1-C subfamily serine protease